MLEDAELLRRYARDKSEAAFAELVARYVDLVYSAALRQVGGDAHRAHDVSQVVFTTLARKADSLASHPVLAGWLYTATQHAAIKAVRAESRRRAREQEAHLMQETNASSDAEADWARVRPVLDEAMRELNERDREAVLLRFFAQRPFAEIARRCALTEDAARMRVERALDKLHALLARRGITSTSAALGVALTHHAVSAAPAGFGTAVATGALSTASIKSPLLGFLQLMSTSKIGGGGAGLVVAFLVADAFREFYVNQAATTALVVARQENETLAAQLLRLQRQAQAEKMAAAAFETKSLEALATQSAEKQRAAAAARAAELEKGNAFVARHPEVKRLYLENQRALAAGRFFYLFKKLQLTPDQIEQFKELVAQNGSGAVSGPGGTIRFTTGVSRDEAQRELHALLGNEGFEDYQKFSNETAAATQMTVQLAGALFDTSSPLTAVQAERLTTILTENRTAPNGSQRLQYEWAAIIPKAREVLSDAQLAMLGRYQAEDELNQAMTRARMEWPRTVSNSSVTSPPEATKP